MSYATVLCCVWFLWLPIVPHCGPRKWTSSHRKLLLWSPNPLWACAESGRDSIGCPCLSHSTRICVPYFPAVTSCWDSYVSFVVQETQAVPRRLRPTSPAAELVPTPPTPQSPNLGTLPSSSWQPSEWAWFSETLESPIPTLAAAGQLHWGSFCFLRTRYGVRKREVDADRRVFCDSAGIKGQEGHMSVLCKLVPSAKEDSQITLASNCFVCSKPWPHFSSQKAGKYLLKRVS